MADRLRELEHASLRAFVESCADHFTGRVLDYGCGKQPYRDVVEAAGGEYVPFDRDGLPGGTGGTIGDADGKFGAVLCTQVIEYTNARSLLDRLHGLLFPGGVLVLTGPTCWPEVEAADLCRYTQAGIRRLLEQAGFTVERLESRGKVEHGMSIGYGAVARA